MLLINNNDINAENNGHGSTSPEKLILEYPFLTASTATRAKLKESTETASTILPFSDSPALQPKRRLPLNMVISAMAEREKGSFSEKEEQDSAFTKLKYVKENANSLQRHTSHKKCKKHRTSMQNRPNVNPEQMHKKDNHTFSSIHTAPSIKHGHENEDVDHTSLNFSGAKEKNANSSYSTPYAKSRFQQLYGNGIKQNFHFPKHDLAKCKTDSKPTGDQLFAPAVSDANTHNSSICACTPQEDKDISVAKPKRYQNFLTSYDLLEYADFPVDIDSTNTHAEVNDATMSDEAEDTEPATCLRVTYTKKNITYSNCNVQNNINIMESHYEFIFQPKLDMPGEQLSMPDLDVFK